MFEGFSSRRTGKDSICFPASQAAQPYLLLCARAGLAAIAQPALHCSSTQPCLSSSCAPLSPAAAAENTTLNPPPTATLVLA